MKALNRKEVLVNAKANGTLDSFKPLTRDEAFTKKALGLGGGDSGGTVLESVSKDVFYVDGEVVFSYDSRENISFNYQPIMVDYLFVETGKYTVVWDGVTYANLVPIMHEFDILCIGAAKMADLNENMPFTIFTTMVGDTYQLRIATHSSAQTHSVSVSERKNFIDRKHLPKATYEENGVVRLGYDVGARVEVHPFVVGEELSGSDFDEMFSEIDRGANVILGGDAVRYMRVDGYTNASRKTGGNGFRYVSGFVSYDGKHQVWIYKVTDGVLSKLTHYDGYLFTPTNAEDDVLVVHAFKTDSGYELRIVKPSDYLT